MATAPDVGQEQDSVVIGEDDLWGTGEYGETDEESSQCLSQRGSVVTTACIGELLGFFSSQNYRTTSSDRRVAEQVGYGASFLRVRFAAAGRATFRVCSASVCA